MKYRISSKNLLTSSDPQLVVVITNEKQARSLMKKLNEISPTTKKAATQAGWSPDSHSSVSFQIPATQCPLKVRTIHLVPLNTKLEPLESWRAVGAYIAKIAAAPGINSISVLLDGVEKEEKESAALQIAQASLYARYEFSRYKSSKTKKGKKTKVEISLYLGKSIRATTLSKKLKELPAKNEALSWARDLVNTPAGDLQPRDFVKEVRKTLRGSSTVRISVLDKAKLQQLKAGALLGVAQGSAAKPYLLKLRYVPKKKSAKRIVLIGKGVTFDSGGLSMKSPTGMVDMKCDMAGAAAVAGVFATINKLPVAARPNVEIHGLIPLVENMVSGSALRPGDVVRSISGKTIEVTNTDAEGRLILADALEYSERLKPTAIIDLATLTGACCVALGEQFAGLFSDDAELSSKLCAAGIASGDHLWPLPFGAQAYRRQLHSSVADIKNSGGRYPGASIAALFLQEFAPKNVPWAHIDIAAPAFLSKDYLYRKRGASGFGITLILEYLSRL